jgi:hypothetical protein
MTRETDNERDQRIRREILTDADTADEQTISWCYAGSVLVDWIYAVQPKAAVPQHLVIDG